MPSAMRPPMQSLMQSVKESAMQSVMEWAMAWAWKSQLPYPLPPCSFVPYPHLVTGRHVCNGGLGDSAQAASRWRGWGQS